MLAEGGHGGILAHDPQPPDSGLGGEVFLLLGLLRLLGLLAVEERVAHGSLLVILALKGAILVKIGETSSSREASERERRDTLSL